MKHPLRLTLALSALLAACNVNPPKPAKVPVAPPASSAPIAPAYLPGNLNRALPPSLDARVDTTSWIVPTLFRVLVDAGGVERAEAFRAFNMGVGMVVITDRAGADALIPAVRGAGVDAWIMGDVVSGTGSVIL